MAKIVESGRMAPHNLEAEQSVLGCALLSADAAVETFSKLDSKDFYSEVHETIFAAMKRLFDRNSPVDFVTLTDELDSVNKLDAVGGVPALTALTNIVPSAVNFLSYVEIVKKNSMLRKLISTCETIIRKSYEPQEEDALRFAEGKIFDLVEHGRTSDLEHIDKSLIEVVEKFEAIHKDKTALQGLSTGFWALDEMTNGLQKSDLIFIAARPGFGKTALAMNIAANAALAGKAKVAVFSLEMPRIQIAQRLICSAAHIDMSKALKGELKSSDFNKIWQAIKKLKNANIVVDDSSLNTPAQILFKCRKIKREMGLDLVVVDYLQLMSGDNKRTENRTLEISEITRRLKIIARELNVPVITISQLSREVEKRTNHRPVLSDLRESGSIEQDADLVMFIHNKDKYQEQVQSESTADQLVEIIVAKHRNGKIGSANLVWRGSSVSFVNQSRDASNQSIFREAPPENKTIEPIPENVMTEIKTIFKAGDE